MYKDHNKESIFKCVIEKLYSCYDPELYVSIVDIGLIYGCRLNEQENTVNEKTDKTTYIVNIEMTLTSPGCQMAPYIISDIRSKILDIEEILDVHIELVFDPQWEQSMMSDELTMIMFPH